MATAAARLNVAEEGELLLLGELHFLFPATLTTGAESIATPLLHDAARIGVTSPAVILLAVTPSQKSAQ